MSDIIFKTLLLKGENGDNIKDIKKTSTNGLVDTYTVTLNNGDTTTFKVTNGKSIVDIKKTGSTGLVDTYTITYNDGTTSTFEITNGEGVDDVRGQICTNLLNPTARTQTIKGVTFTNNGDGTYTVNGTATGDIYFRLQQNFNISSGTYRLNCCVSPSYGGIYCYLQSDKMLIDEVTGIATIPNSSNCMFILRIASGQVLTNEVIKPMLTTDLSATYDDYVPYTGDSGRLNEDVANLVDLFNGISAITNSDIDTILNS